MGGVGGGGGGGVGVMGRWEEGGKMAGNKAKCIAGTILHANVIAFLCFKFVFQIFAGV